MRKIIALLITFSLTVSSVFAGSISKTVRSLGINPSAVSLSVKEVKNGNTIYSLNEKVPMNPASTLKLLTSAASYDTLGKDFVFSTELYKSTNNDLYLKLSADPFLQSTDLNTLFETAAKKNIFEPKKIYIDNTLFDNNEWGEGWQWDDDLNPLMPKFSIYNLDNNLISIELTPISDNVAPTVNIKPFYPVTVMNLVQTDLKSGDNHFKVERNNSIAPNIVSISGFISKTSIIKIPINNLKVYFRLRLEDAIKNAKIDYYSPFGYTKLPTTNIYLVDKIEHSINEILKSVLKNSDNCNAETLFKVAGATWANSQGNTQNSLDMLNSYLKNLGLNTEDIKIVDGSGVSKNNLVSADFMTDFLVKASKNEEFEELKQYLPTAGEGTLKNRMLYFKDNLRAKTGTLSDTSAIAGYIKTRSGKTYAFDIMIRDAKTSSSEKKNIEEQILRQIYMN